jgi:hypothetical protein
MYQNSRDININNNVDILISIMIDHKPMILQS